MTNTTLFTNFIKVFTFAVCFCMFKTSYITSHFPAPEVYEFLPKIACGTNVVQIRR